ncbi:DUF1697 domain-containing protein [Sphingomicrobium astaxanthinifaciens]|uniref:DUF1697 domain-containing protein n=1 Tax=Sphingomicrobium astaxanthinifaciens TaxID=1227949 RepID=UPI001FCBE0CA|nr:DUF1697 domain-containing protein [Sphingomicrobium astaxanthinifaciens]MCJ7421871.1 DUF1697 domain-containing protein [Sphingomicrobium astaxanthinifaciens]
MRNDEREEGEVTEKVTLLRAINAGTPLKMDALRALAAAAGYADPRTYIASGNLLLDTDDGEAQVRARLGPALEAHVGAPVPLFVRTADELDALLAANPWPDAPGNKVMALFLDEAPTQADIAAATNITDEQIALGTRHLYLHYPTGQGRSRMKLPALGRGTARNLNTVASLAALARS